MGVLICLTASVSYAQYEFRDNPTSTSDGLGPYRQNFDALANTNTNFVSNTTLPGVYARFKLNSFGGEYESYYRYSGPYARLGPDDGSEGPNRSTLTNNGTAHGPAWYHFGTTGSSDRALGGIAGTSTLPGQGYVGIRLKNSSSKTIVNLEVEYAMEQWYNSRQTQAANVTVHYQRSKDAITSLFAGSWAPIAALGVAAPSTATAIAPRDGNAATNRRVLRTTLTNLNLKKDEEIMVRFGYTFDSGTNGNGLSIDDVVITPQTNIFYSEADGSKKLTSKQNWGTNLDGSGSNPGNFSADNTTYYVLGNAASISRIDQTWTVTGQNSKIVVGDGTTPTTLYLGAADDIAGPVDVSANTTLQIANPNSAIVLGGLHPTSTLEYINTGTTAQRIGGGSYGTLKLTGDGPRTLAGPVLVQTSLNYATAATSPLSLGASDLLLLKETVLAGPARTSTLFVTNGAGSLRRTVPGDGTLVLFPVGTSATSYTPATLSQTGLLAEDTYSVRAADNAYSNYTVSGAGLGSALNFRNVKKTWFLAEEVPGNSNITLALQWSAADASTDFQPGTAHINHYTGGAWDSVLPTTGAGAGTPASSFSVSRAGITSFSPFGVSSQPSGPLPVELIDFTARRQGSSVVCVWATASEKNSRDFVVERSADGRAFAVLGSVAAAGNSSDLRQYILADAHPLPMLAYYRLRQNDLDGTASFSPVVTVAGTAEAGTPVVVPNPGTGCFEVLMGAGQRLSAPLVVRNVLGAEVLRLPSARLEASSATQFDLSHLPAGLYLVQVETGAGSRMLRVVKQ